MIGTNLRNDGQVVVVSNRLVQQREQASSAARSQIEIAMNWMWQFHGHLLIISIPYYDGKRYATRPNHFLPIINQLEHLHVAGYVHGDIRAYNMVFHHDKETADVTDGRLIDFDIGGPIESDTTRYPVGQKRAS